MRIKDEFYVPTEIQDNRTVKVGDILYLGMRGTPSEPRRQCPTTL